MKKRLLVFAYHLENLNRIAAIIARWAILLMLGLGLWNVIGRYLGVIIGHNLSSNGLIEGHTKKLPFSKNVSYSPFCSPFM